jgi:hypothetical protein
MPVSASQCQLPGTSELQPTPAILSSINTLPPLPSSSAPLPFFQPTAIRSGGRSQPCQLGAFLTRGDDGQRGNVPGQQDQPVPRPTRFPLFDSRPTRILFPGPRPPCRHRPRQAIIARDPVSQSPSRQTGPSTPQGSSAKPSGPRSSSLPKQPPSNLRCLS